MADTSEISQILYGEETGRMTTLLRRREYLSVLLIIEGLHFESLVDAMRNNQSIHEAEKTLKPEDLKRIAIAYEVCISVLESSVLSIALKKVD